MSCLIVFIVALDASLWWLAQRQLQNALYLGQRELRAVHATLDDSGTHRGGWPWRADLVIASPRVLLDDGRVRWGGQRIRLSLSLWTPGHVSIFLAGAQAAQADNAGALTATTQDVAMTIRTRAFGTLVHFITPRVEVSAIWHGHRVGGLLHNASGEILVNDKARRGQTAFGVDIHADAVLPDLADWPSFQQVRHALPGWPPRNVRLTLAALSADDRAAASDHRYSRLLVQNVAWQLGPLSVRGAGSVTLPDGNGELSFHVDGLHALAEDYWTRFAAEHPNAMTIRQGALADIWMDRIHQHIAGLPASLDLSVPVIAGEPDFHYAYP